MILLVDAHAWTREAIARGLEVTTRDLRVLRFADLSELSGTETRTGAAVVLLNLTEVGLDDHRLSSAIAAIGSSLPDLPVAVLSDSGDIEVILKAMAHGLRGYLPMSMEPVLVAQALRFIAAGGIFLPVQSLLTSLQIPASDNLPVALPSAPKPAPVGNRLTPRELAVLKLVAQGKSNKQIARELNMSEATVKVHVHHIMSKLGAANRTQVALFAGELKS
jgi:DNA-binding NarL/FixJ family response regulator